MVAVSRNDGRYGVGIMTKVKVPREVAEAIEELRGLGLINSEILMKAVDGTPLETEAEWALFDWACEEGEDSLMTALVIGYEVEKTPEEMLHECYEELKQSSLECEYECKARTIVHTLEILGIKIGGINA